jgi:hypothetical protein
MAVHKESLGFGYIPAESGHHFLVSIPRNTEQCVTIYERFKWQEEVQTQTIDFNNDKAKVELSKHKWKLIEDTLRIEFNNRLKKENIGVGKWHIGQIPVQRLLGKEMVLLAWAIEDCDPSVIPIATKNWMGLSPEERWWLFTMTNAATGNFNDKRGWRKAIRYALTENPIEDKSPKQMSLFDMAIKRQIDD